MANRSTFVGLDVHKESIAVAIAESGRFGEVREYGTVAGELDALDKVLRALRAPGRTLHVVYEAGPPVGSRSSGTSRGWARTARW
jgi:hypothetical protein